MAFDAVLILGKELRRDPQRGRAELAARAAAAAAWHRSGVRYVVSLEARLRGQDKPGSLLVSEALTGFGVPKSDMILQTVTHSTREEAVVANALSEERGWNRIIAITASYHLPRSRRYFDEVMGSERVVVQTPESGLQWATPVQRAAIIAGAVSSQTAKIEAHNERRWTVMSTMVKPLPVRLRWAMEIQAGRLFRAS